MSIEINQRRQQAQAEVRERVRRVVISLIYLCGAAGGGALGIVLMPHLDKILMVALLLALVGVLAAVILHDIRSR